ncbi:hypothetical protein KAR91_14600 [Candidatus Pacearchaeota archaeon]|nr:hypothetical protein [Candidatus Pacearchaeota archaeon]
MKNNKFQLLLFSTKKEIVTYALSGGVYGFIVDWEVVGKAERQRGFDTQINKDTIEDLKRVRSLTDALVVCRINRNTDIQTCNKEIDAAVDVGADEILLPMVRTVEEVETVLDYTNGRCGVGILIETNDAVKLSCKLGQLPLSRVYVGLNDLAIDRKETNIFCSLEDGTIDYVRQFIKVPFGFAGLTLPECGYPIPCRLLISEMARLNCSFALLRRSFFADTKGKDISIEIPRIYDAISRAFQSSDEEKARNRVKIKEVIRDCSSFFNAPARL